MKRLYAKSVLPNYSKQVLRCSKMLVVCIVTLMCLFHSIGLCAAKTVKFKVKNTDGFKISYEVKEGTSDLVCITDASVKKNAVFHIPETVEYEGQAYIIVEIADNAFKSAPFSAVELPNTIRRIGKIAFLSCERLERINLPEGLLIIDNLAFAYTHRLKQLAIPSSVIYIGDRAFQNWHVSSYGSEDYPKTCELVNLPAIVTPDNSEQYGLSQKSVAEYYAAHEAPMPIVDVNSEDVQREIAYWNSTSDSKWSKRIKISQAIAVGATVVAVGALAASATANSGSPAQQFSNQFNQQIQPSFGSSDYYTSSAYLAQVQANANQSMANSQTQIQSIGQQAQVNYQQGINRINQMTQDKLAWTNQFQSRNDRTPTSYEETQWILQNYPDLYELHMQTLITQNAQQEESETETDNTGVDYRKSYKKIEDNIESFHKAFSSGGTVTIDTEGNIKDKKDSSVSGATYLQQQEVYKKLQNELKRIREEAATHGITIVSSKWETSELKP